MNCPSCGAPMYLNAGNSSLRCEYCHSVVVVSAEDSEIRFFEEFQGNCPCPICSETLWAAVIAGFQVGACKRCKGLLIPMSSFEALIVALREIYRGHADPTRPNPDDLHRVILCSRCNKHMEVHYYMGGGNLVMGSCESCCLHWLDSGALKGCVLTQSRDLGDR